VDKRAWCQSNGSNLTQYRGEQRGYPFVILATRKTTLLPGQNLQEIRYRLGITTRDVTVVKRLPKQQEIWSSTYSMLG
jgi:hypothetical protein